MEINDAVAALAALAQESRLDAFRLLVQAGPEGMQAGQSCGSAWRTAEHAHLSFRPVARWRASFERSARRPLDDLRRALRRR